MSIDGIVVLPMFYPKELLCFEFYLSFRCHVCSLSMKRARERERETERERERERVCVCVCVEKSFTLDLKDIQF